ncbi:MAG: DinB family protein [Chloroflexota bacterium]
MSANDPQTLISAIAAAGEEFAALVESLTPVQFHRRPEPDAWSAAEIAGHVSEAPVTFAAHALRVAANPGAAVGRALDEPGRLAALKRLGNAGPSEAGALVRQGVGQAVEMLSTMPAEGWQALGQSARLGAVPMLQFIDSVVLQHIRGHITQAREAAGA